MEAQGRTARGRSGRFADSYCRSARDRIGPSVDQYFFGPLSIAWRSVRTVRWLFLSPVVLAAIPMCVASLRGNWWLAAAPYGLFSWGFATIVLSGPEQSSNNPLHLVWLVSLVLLLSSMARNPRPGSWWWDRLRSWRGRWMRAPGPVVGLLLAAWIVSAPVPLVGLLVTLALVGAVGTFLAWERVQRSWPSSVGTHVGSRWR